MDAFDLEVLARVGDDYEAVHTIRGDIERDLGRSVSDAEVATALLRLEALGFVDAFEFDTAGNRFAHTASTGRDTNDLWFQMSTLGRLEYEKLEA